MAEGNVARSLPVPCPFLACALLVARLFRAFSLRVTRLFHARPLLALPFRSWHV